MGAPSGNAITGDGTTNRIAKFTDAGTLGDSALYEHNYCVGVGTENPRGKFDVDCDSGDIYLDTFSSKIYIGDVDGDGDGTLFTVDDSVGKFTFENGNVGIGTTSPEALLHCVTSDDTGVRGTSYFGHGIYGYSELDAGVYGFSGNYTGVYGESYFDAGVYGESQLGIGVYGESFENYAGYFDGDVYVTSGVSASSFFDRTPYPKDLDTAYKAVMSMQRLPDGQYKQDNKQVQLDHSMLSDFIRSGDGNRDLSATVSCQNEVIKDLIKQNEELKERLDALERKLSKM